MLLTSPKMPSILRHITVATSACHPVSEPPAITLQSSLGNSLVSAVDRQIDQVFPQNPPQERKKNPRDWPCASARLTEVIWSLQDRVVELLVQLQVSARVRVVGVVGGQRGGGGRLGARAAEGVHGGGALRTWTVKKGVLNRKLQDF